MERDANGKKTKTPKFTLRTTSTALQVATDHAFTGTYARRFRPADPPSSHGCPCGEPTRLAEHILLHCPWFVQPRISYAILSTAWNPIHPLMHYPRFFTTRGGAEKMCKFLQFTRALSKPESGPLPDVPPEPD
ncbi:hypothetical protein EDB89DRAFT_1867547 [Lactarius sanguifluus]|nr:hypothetical protein EDB89DRAFT_1867547 [Lactarius sanguifluus]